MATRLQPLRHWSSITRRRFGVTLWVALMSSMIGRAALELARETGIFPAAVFVGLMGLFVYALWEYFPGYPEAAEQGDSGGTPGSSDRSVRFAARDDATNTEDMSA